jgi:hypothetical protein
METINLSGFASGIRYVPLETGMNNYISYISDCKFIGNYLIVINLKQCLLYDVNGKFIKQIGTEGRGPGEYQYVDAVVVDCDTNIYIQSLYDLLEFKVDGSFVEKKKNRFMLNNNMNEYFITSLIIRDSLFFGHIPNSTGLINNKALLIKKSGEIIKSYKNHILFDREKPVGSYLENFAHIYQFDRSIYYKEYYNDTLFCLDDQLNLNPKYVLDPGKYKEPVSERAKRHSQPKSAAEYHSIWEVFQIDKYLFISCGYGDHFPAKRITPEIVNLPDGRAIKILRNTDRVLGIYNKETRNISFCKPTSTDNKLFTSGLCNDFDAGPRFFPTMQVNDSTMMMWIKAEDLINHIESNDFNNCEAVFPAKKKQLAEMVHKLSPQDNPVLMFVTFR